MQFARHEGMYDRDWHLFVKFVGKVSHFANIRDMYGKRLSSMTNLGISDESNSDQSDYERTSYIDYFDEMICPCIEGLCFQV